MTSLSDFETCPRRYSEVRVLKRFKEPASSALAAGQVLHEALERAARGDLPDAANVKELAPALRLIEALKTGLRNAQVFAEHKLALDRDLRPVDWWDEAAWVRAIADLLLLAGNSAVIVDWKTGKPKDDPSQLDLLAACTMAAYPEVEEVAATYFWFTAPAGSRVSWRRLSRRNLTELWGGFLPRAEKLAAAFERNDFPPIRSGLCRAHCPVTSCEFNGRYKP